MCHSGVGEATSWPRSPCTWWRASLLSPGEPALRQHGATEPLALSGERSPCWQESEDGDTGRLSWSSHPPSCWRQLLEAVRASSSLRVGSRGGSHCLGAVLLTVPNASTTLRRLSLLAQA